MASSQPATQDESELEGIDAFALGTLTALQMLRYLRYCLRCLATARACGMEPAVAEDWFHHAEQCRRIALALAYVNNSLSRQPDQPELIHRSLAISVRLQEAGGCPRGC